MIAPERAIPLQESVDPDRIRLDLELQSREATDERIVSEYAAAMTEGSTFPPVVLYYDGATYWCADGWHRVLAARAAGASEIDAEIRQGTRRDALRHALGANAAHGVRRTSADKRRAVLLALADEEWSQLSDREIARLCAVSHTFVAGFRRPRPESSGNVATPSPVAAAALATSVGISTTPPISTSGDSDRQPTRTEVLRAALTCLDHGCSGQASTRQLREALERAIAENFSYLEWAAILEAGVARGLWSLDGDTIQSATPRVRTAPPAADSPIPRSEREAGGGGQDLRTSPVGSAPPASLSSVPVEDDHDWTACDRCDGKGVHPDTEEDCLHCGGDGGWREPPVQKRPPKNLDEDDEAPLVPSSISETAIVSSSVPRPKAEKPRPSALPPDDLSPTVLHLGDCVEWLLSLEPESVDAIVCDPPYGLGFMGKAWDALPPGVEWARACLRALKPGGHLIAFGGTRTVHRLTCAIEDAGFEIRDQIGWVYFSGFPKSLDVSKAIDEAAGAEREVVGSRLGQPGYSPGWLEGEGRQEGESLQPGRTLSSRASMLEITAPATPDAKRWSGWGTALKPAIEPAILARKPLAGTVAANVREHGTGALNIDGCRFVRGDPAWVGPQEKDDTTRPGNQFRGHIYGEGTREGLCGGHPVGRWPANLYYTPKASRRERERGCEGLPARTGAEATDREPDTAGLSSPRAGAGRTASGVRNFHPTVKPVALMRWLVRLVTPPGGLVVDPFTGSGTTGVAAVLEGFRFAGAERDPDYHLIAGARLAHAAEHPEEWGGVAEDEDLEGEAL